MKYLLIFITFISFFASPLQAHSYTVEMDEIPYDTLNEYTSLAHEKVLRGELPYWYEEQIDFGFEFPFFDSTLTYIILSNDCTGYIPEAQETQVIDVQGLQTNNYFINLAHSRGADTFRFIKI